MKTYLVYSSASDVVFDAFQVLAESYRDAIKSAKDMLTEEEFETVEVEELSGRDI